MKKFDRARKEVNHLSKSQKVLITIIVLLTIFGGVTRFTQGNFLSDFAYSSISMIRYSLVEGPIKAITNFSSDLAELYKVRDENDDLRSKISSQKMYKEELDEANRKISELEELLNVTKTSGFSPIYCNILNRDIQGWANSVTINKGSDDGIAVDNVVICSKGLIGKVVDVNANTSRVKLLTTESADNSVSVKVELNKESTTEGILQNYDASSGNYIVEIYDASAKITKGMSVVTSGKGGIYPSGILCGKVTSTSELYNSTGQTVMVEPSVNFSDFEYVAVLKGSE